MLGAVFIAAMLVHDLCVCVCVCHAIMSVLMMSAIQIRLVLSMCTQASEVSVIIRAVAIFLIRFRKLHNNTHALSTNYSHISIS